MLQHARQRMNERMNAGEKIHEIELLSDECVLQTAHTCSVDLEPAHAK